MGGIFLPHFRSEFGLILLMLERAFSLDVVGPNAIFGYGHVWNRAGAEILGTAGAYGWNAVFTFGTVVHAAGAFVWNLDDSIHGLCVVGASRPEERG